MPTLMELMNYGARQGGAPGVKGPGYFGPLQRPDRGVSTELSFDFDVGGKRIFAPLLVPTLTKDEVTHLLGDGQPTPEIYQKAQDFALQRLRSGLDPFAAYGEQQSNMGQPAIAANQDQSLMQFMRRHFRGY